MNVEFEQDRFDGERQGYARLIVELDDYDGCQLAATDSIAVGRTGADGNMEYLSPGQEGIIDLDVYD